MQLNYFGALRLIMGFLPKMIEQKRGHIINISLDRRAVERAAVLGLRRVEGGAGLVRGVRAVGVRRQGHQLHDDQHAAGAHADDRADQDVRERPDAVARSRRPTWSSRRSSTSRCASPPGSASSARSRTRRRRSLTQIMLNTAFNMFPDSAAAQGKKGEASAPAAAFARADGVRPAHAGHPLVGHPGPPRTNAGPARVRRFFLHDRARSSDARGRGRAATTEGRLFSWFERLVDPYPDALPPTPPRGFFAFLWACTRGLRRYLLAMTLLTAVIGAFEALLFGMLGSIVDWLAAVEPAQLWAQQRGKLLLLAARARRQHAPGRAAVGRSSTRRSSATSRCCCAGTSTA